MSWARRAVTGAQIARATEAERAEARSASADRRRRLRAELGDHADGIAALLENSLLGADGVPDLPFLGLQINWLGFQGKSWFYI